MDFTETFVFILLYLQVMRLGFITTAKHIPVTSKEQNKFSVNVSRFVVATPGASGLTKQDGDGVDIVIGSGFNQTKQDLRNASEVVESTAMYKEPWELNYDLCPPSLCIANEEQRPRGTGGSVFYNGDIVLDKESAKIIYSNMTSARYKRATTRNPRTWRNGIVPYMFASDIAPLSASVIGEAMRTIERETCIRFKRRRLRDEDYIRFISEPGCWSAVGRVGGEQKVSIGPECERLGIVIHEILHALGFWHEQARPDRDNYVQIIEENIEPKYIPDFKQTNKMLVTSRGFPYDYQSVMHYGNKAFTKEGKDTIQVIGIGKQLQMKIGQRVALSNIDIAQLRDMYNCFSKEAAYTYCPPEWIKIGRNCYKFEDRQVEDFAGAVTKCDEMHSQLVQPKDSVEKFNIEQYIKGVYPNIRVWRTGERIMNGSFAWYSGEVGGKVIYTKWNESKPGTYSSFARLSRTRKRRSSTRKRRSHRDGVWIDSFHACPFICEQRAKYRCVLGVFPDGRDYRGTLDHTIDGYTCQKWSLQYPWAHSLLEYPYFDTENKQDGLGEHNFCRNPSRDRKDRPWCYTTKSDVKWQFCDVSVCMKTGNRVAPNKTDIQYGNVTGNDTFYKTYSENPKNGTTFEEGRSSQNVSQITLKKHRPYITTSKARRLREPPFPKRKNSSRRKNSRKAGKYNEQSRPKSNKKLLKKRNGASRMSRKRFKFKRSKY